MANALTSLITIIKGVLLDSGVDIPLLFSGISGLILVTPKEKVASTLSSFGLDGVKLSEIINDNKKILTLFMFGAGALGAGVGIEEIAVAESNIYSNPNAVPISTYPYYKIVQ